MALRASTALFALAALAATAFPARAAPPGTPGCAFVEVSSEGLVLAPSRLAGLDWIAGRPGARYALSIVNGCPFKIVATVSVDGLDAFSGFPATGRSSGRAVEPGGRSSIAGWRASRLEEASFAFSGPGSPYKIRLGRQEDAGTIAAAFFREATPRGAERGPEVEREPAPFHAQSLRVQTRARLVERGAVADPDPRSAEPPRPPVGK